MKIPDGPTGHPTVSASQLRTYGAAGFLLDTQEEERGCPRQYKAKYVDRIVPRDSGGTSYPLAYGTFFHEIMYLMEEEDVTPEVAMERAFPVDGDPAMWTEARADLTAYMERGASPSDRFATVAVETELDAELYVDEDFGPIHYRGFLDHIGVDPDQPNTLVLTDYKTNRTPPSRDQVLGDAQMKGYAWLAQQNRGRFGFQGAVNVVVVLDCVKWFPIEVRFTDQEIEEWRDWCVAVCRKIRRDDEAKPKINPGCAYCPVAGDCPAFNALPSTAHQMAGALENIEDPVERLAWRDAANQVRLLLSKKVASIDGAFKDQALADGEIVVGDVVFRAEPDWKTVIDTRAAHRALGDVFYDLVTLSKAKIEKATQEWDVGRVVPVKEAIERVPTGTTVNRRKREQ